ncbi:PREDICTED: sodium-dependent proline transporter-like isoform X3 [Haliaeetus leucocephalus]|uniref:sodium-dependent proline transporter-like isoform X3 n=1 Tax=Haliaeetus leucocephalus TaxID=52644 RepID=UPI00053CD50C|nr:PREDICTED: sodium-dependent proline transporter-like isoform X3 [Haliaeetus leucocephalus]
MPGTGHLDMPGPPAPATPPEPTVNILQIEGPTTDSTSQPWPGPPPQPDIPAPSSHWLTWTDKYKFLLSCLGYCVGLGNIWRFPYLCYRNGGGIFLIPFFIMSLIMGLPLFLMELSLGQYGATGPITVWKCCPLLKGIGIAMLIASSLVCVYYNVIIAWAFYYLGSSFQSPLPWSCDAPGNAYFCQNASGIVSASEVFWNEQVLGVMHSSGLGDPGAVQWPLALCLLAAWIIVFFCTLKGIHSSGKMVYVTATFPYLVILTLIIWGATLDGSLDGVRFYLSLDWSRLQSAQVWSDAASQVFYSLGVGFGGLVSLASYNEFDSNVIRNTLVLAIGTCCTSFFAGFAIFSLMGHMAWRIQVPVGSVTDSGPGLMFVAYPEALSLLPISPLWSILFFLTLIMLGVDTLFGNIKGITRAILDEFPALDNQRKKAALLGALCTSFCLLGLPLVTQGGIFWFTLIDKYSTGFGLITVSLFMCLGITFCYGVNQFCQDIMDMIRQCPPWCKHMLGYFKACWAFFTPCLLLVSTEHAPGAGGRGEKSSPPSISPSPLRGAALAMGLERGCPVLVPPWACLWLLEGAQGTPGGPCGSQPGQDPWGQAVPWRHVGCARSALQSVLVCTCLDMHRMPLHHGIYEYPTWGTNLGICMGVLTCLQVPLWAVVALCRQSGTLRNRFQEAIQPLPSWRAAAGRNMDGVIAWRRSPSP